jgi:Staphylococcal nuclease homologue
LLQEELVAKGLARVYSFPDNRACVAELLARETEARAKRLGVWGSPAYRIQDPSTSSGWDASPIPISWSRVPWPQWVRGVAGSI